MTAKVYHIQVTEQDIAYGVRNECDSCPVAVAIARATQASIVDVIAPEVFFYFNGESNSPFPQAMLDNETCRTIAMADRCNHLNLTWR